MTSAAWPALLGLLVLVFPASRGVAQKDDKPFPDFTRLDPAELGVELVKPAKDPKTGFVVGGKNPTELIRKLTHINGLSIARLEKIMRPGASSSAGFLGPEESLLEVMAEDNRTVVEEMGLTHQELARHLHVLGAIGARRKEAEKGFRYHGRRFKVRVMFTRGLQPSPFDDDTKSGANAKLTNLDTGKELRFALLVPYMIDRYGFYEGKGTTYRVDPRQVVEVLDFLKPRGKKAKY